MGVGRKILGGATKLVNRAGSGIENIAGAAHVGRTAATGVAKPKGFLNRGISAVGSAMRRATPTQVGVGLGAAGAVGAAGYMHHRANKQRQQQQMG